MSFRDRIRHAFAVPKREELVVTDEVRELVDRFCRGLVRRDLSAPALILLEMSRPLNFVGAQAMHALTPLLGLVGDAKSAEALAKFLEQRGSVEYVVDRLQEFQKDRPPS